MISIKSILPIIDMTNMKEKTLSQNYEESYEQVSVVPQQTDEQETNMFANLVISDQKLRILDLGCAEGKLAILLALKGHSVTAADISVNYLNQAEVAAKKNSVRLNIIKCNIEEGISEFKYNQFFMDIIEHLKKPIAALENIRMLLVDEGVLYIHTPNVYNLPRLFRYISKPRSLENYYDMKNLGDLHFQTYDYMSLEKSLNFVGFRVNEVLPTRVTIPIVNYSIRFLSKFLSTRFPFLSDNLLLKCIKSRPIDIEKQISYWHGTIVTNACNKG
jgi:2-polyprenyl-3-methyl-5-hydroxy-6-metoxy-1,4-benzoquinol methylase